jgi:integrase
MQTIKTRLSDTTASAAAHDGRPGDLFLWDNAITGFTLRLRPGAKAGELGGKSWMFRYRTGGKLRVLGLGSAAKTSAAAARKAAGNAQTATRGGGDPVQAKQEKRAEPTMAELLRGYLMHCQRRVALAEREEVGAEQGRSVTRRGVRRHAGAMSATTLDSYRRRIDGYLIPAFGSLKASELNRERVRAWAATAASAATGEPLSEGLRNTVLRILAAALSWAKDAGFPVSADATRDLGQYAVIQRSHPLTEDELRRAMAAIAEKARQKPIQAAALRLLILSGARAMEVLTLRWDAVDLATGTIAISRHKTSRSSGAKVLMVTPEMRSVLAEAARFRRPGCDYVFPSTADQNPLVKQGRITRADLARQMRGHVSLEAVRDCWFAALKEAGIARRRLHDLRHTMGHLAVAAGVDLAAIAAQLGHRSVMTTQRYAKADPQAAARATAAVAAVIAFPTTKEAG